MGHVATCHRHVDGEQFREPAHPHLSVPVDQDEYGGGPCRAVVWQPSAETTFHGTDGAELSGQLLVMTLRGHGTSYVVA
ncbi:hypothetical protein GCM10010449_52020 [Streptomyces rectiviolaceus]|uniref:AraC family transcriptional regulator n=1 Tax=Streptomyces rectiviolaceus TaxID=332591 RepID=A0ABP6MWV1_9ACTN